MPSKRLTEGKVRKGGRNKPPRSPRPKVRPQGEPPPDHGDPMFFKDHDGKYKAKWPSGEVTVVPEPEPPKSHKEQLGDQWPTGNHPTTGEPFEKVVSMEVKTDIQEHHYGPPGKPDRALWDYDDDEPRYIRDLTAEEYDAAWKEYEQAKEEWGKTNGLMRTHGGSTTTGKFKTASGAWAEGTWLDRPGEWHWTNSGTADVSRETIGGDQ